MKCFHARKSRSRGTTSRGGCGKFAEICKELSLPEKRFTWDTDEDGDWAGHVQGVDD